ncbi:helix-turn-helix domain-containing protein [Ottowia sp.]|uniref:helix-turn-helix domain-containing protein n=1 Tax=Ottowia sp. TaxID=1898956 RepID=UPI0039E36078
MVEHPSTLPRVLAKTAGAEAGHLAQAVPRPAGQQCDLEEALMQDSFASPAPDAPQPAEEPARQRAASICPSPLTRHEVALMQGVAAGFTNQQLAKAFNRSEKTIRNQLTQLYLKLGARNRAEAVAIYLRQGD